MIKPTFLKKCETAYRLIAECGVTYLATYGLLTHPVATSFLTFYYLADTILYGIIHPALYADYNPYKHNRTKATMARAGRNLLQLVVAGLGAQFFLLAAASESQAYMIECTIAIAIVKGMCEILYVAAEERQQTSGFVSNNSFYYNPSRVR